MISLERYLEIPFLDGGRSFNGADCYGLVRLIHMSENIGQLPEFCGIGAKETLKIRSAVSDNQCNCSEWKKVENDVKFGDVVLLKINGAPVHVGMMLDAKKFIHISDKIDCSIDSLSTSRWRTRIEGIYRHQNG